jgi:membrane protein YdbS with pleckstrin-like domain
MYEATKSLLLRLAKVPPEPHDPMGDVQSLRVFRAAPGYWRYLVAGWLIAQFALLAGFSAALTVIVVVGSLTKMAAIVTTVVGFMALTFIATQAVITFFWLRLNYELRWYKVTDRSLRIRAGIWNVHEMTLTFANIQNITITQGALERLFGISDVRVETAGGGSGTHHAHGGGAGGNLHAGVFRGVADPEAIRGLMLERLRRLADTGLGNVDETQDGEGTPARGVGSVASPEMLRVLAAFRDEARALRRAAERATQC